VIQEKKRTKEKNKKKLVKVQEEARLSSFLAVSFTLFVLSKT
jgi:hypothetical protein